MVCNNWNPIKDLGDEWRASANIWGKLKVFFFYSYVWVMIFGCIYQAFRPWAFSNDCLLAESTKHQNEIAFLTRQYDVVTVAWLLYVAKAKSTLPNLRAFVAVLFVSCMFGGFFEGKIIFAGACGDTWMAQWYIWLGWPVLGIIFAYIERRMNNRSGNASETQALV